MKERRRGAHLPVSGHLACRWMDHKVCDAWPVQRQTYGYLPSRRASPPLGRYQIILLGDRAACSGIIQKKMIVHVLADSLVLIDG